jgi:effector-binding domain-containing protein
MQEEDENGWRHGFHAKNDDVEGIKEVFTALRNEIPALIRELMDTVYSEESAERMARSVATFHRTLANSGIPEREALDMTKGYIFDLRNIGKGFA